MATALSPDECRITLPAKWVDAFAFEAALRSAGDAHGTGVRSVVVELPAECRLMIDVAIRLLSLCNQLAACSKRVRLDFALLGDLRGYLSRMGFFDHLSGHVDVLPNRPVISGANLHRGGNQGLVEIERFNRKDGVDQALVGRLAQTVQRGCAGRSDVTAIHSAVFSIFGELIHNVFDHSQSTLDAYAAVQTYRGGNRVTVAVSDSGIGIMNSLRPALKNTRWDNLSEVELLIEMFKEGISSKNEDKRGLGLKTSARHAALFGADLDVRLLNQRVFLKPASNVDAPHVAYPQAGLPLIWGTHIAFSFKLD